MYEFLKSLIGNQFDDLVGDYEGYNKDVDPTTSMVFGKHTFQY